MSTQDPPFLRVLDKATRFELYKYVLSLDSVDRWIERFDKSINAPYHVRIGLQDQISHHLSHGARFPRDLMINRQIYEEIKETIPFLQLSLTRGIEVYNRLNICQLTTEQSLRSLHLLSISDIGLSDYLCRPDFSRVTELIEQIAEVLRHGHSLSQFRLALGQRWSRGNAPPLTRIEPALVRRMQKSLVQLRGIPRVTIKVDFPHELSGNQVADIMRSEPSALLRLPYNVRQRIYRYAADHNDQVRALERFITSQEPDPEMPQRTTPTILLLNRQISEEAQRAIISVPLMFSDVGLGRVFSLHPEDDFFSRMYLSNLEHIRLEFTSARNLNLLQTPSSHFRRLKTLELRYHEPDLCMDILMARQPYPPRDVFAHFTHLNALRGLDRAEITGTLPRCFTLPLQANMTSSEETIWQWKLGVITHRGRVEHYEDMYTHLREGEAVPFDLEDDEISAAGSDGSLTSDTNSDGRSEEEEVINHDEYWQRYGRGGYGYEEDGEVSIWQEALERDVELEEERERQRRLWISDESAQEAFSADHEAHPEDFYHGS